MKRILRICLFLSLIPLSSGAVAASPLSSHSTPRIAIIIDDIGNNLHLGLRAVRLPGSVTCAFLPHTIYARRLAIAAHKRNKEVMLHLPMQSEIGKAPGPGALTLDMTRKEFNHTVEGDLAAIPYIAGVNNHMGSLMTQHPGDMRWLMQDINRHGNLFFVDSRTTEYTVAQQVAQENGIPNLRRDVFLDNDQHLAAIAAQFARLIALAKRRGGAVAIGHPHPNTLRFLARQLPRLADEGIELVSASDLIKFKQSPGRVYAAAPLLMGAAKTDITPAAGRHAAVATP
ncbi:MAG: divergent polysaccharide deacetylase family protein [Gammaproteobacteria bacterium]|jgi:polysaccharide deacetylase 2 family uncharacterized protein YibQ